MRAQTLGQSSLSYHHCHYQNGNSQQATRSKGERTSQGQTRRIIYEPKVRKEGEEVCPVFSNATCWKLTSLGLFSLVHPRRLAQSQTLTPILIQMPLLPDPTLIRHPGPRVHVQDLGLGHLPVRRDAEGASPRWIVATVVGEAPIDGDVTRVKNFRMMTGGDDSSRAAQTLQASITRCFLHRSSPFYFIIAVSPIPC